MCGRTSCSSTAFASTAISSRPGAASQCRWQQKSSGSPGSPERRQHSTCRGLEKGTQSHQTFVKSSVWCGTKDYPSTQVGGGERLGNSPGKLPLMFLLHLWSWGALPTHVWLHVKGSLFLRCGNWGRTPSSMNGDIFACVWWQTRPTSSMVRGQLDSLQDRGCYVALRCFASSAISFGDAWERTVRGRLVRKKL